MTKELEKLYYLLTEAITNADGTNKPKNEHVSICYTDLQQYINEQEKKDERHAKELELLELYRNKNKLLMADVWVASAYKDIDKRITELEEEMK